MEWINYSVALGIETRASYGQGKCSAIELQPLANIGVFNNLDSKSL